MFRLSIAALFTFIGLGFPCLGEQVFYEDFTGKLDTWKLDKGGMVSNEEAAIGGQCLVAKGNGESYQYVARHDSIDVKPGERFGLSCKSRCSEGFDSGLGMILCLFKDDEGRAVGQARLDFSRSSVWKFKEITFDVPEGASSLDVTVRLASVSTPHEVLVDGIRLVRIKTDDDFYVRRISTVFDNWNPRDPLPERCRFGSGGKLLHDWTAAYIGETCVEARGDNTLYQYPLWIDSITVKPGVQYDAAVHIRTSKGLVGRNTAMMIFFFNDAENKTIGQERLPLSSSLEWTEAKKKITPCDGTISMSIGLRLLNVGPEEIVYADNLRFFELPAAALLEVSSDPTNAQIQLILNATTDIKFQNVQEAAVKICNATGGIVWQRDVPLGEAVKIPVRDWPDGPYSMSGFVKMTDGSALSSTTTTMNIYNKRSWEGNGLGKVAPNAPPPAPWSPIQHDGNVTRTWNNTFTFGKTLQLTDVRFGNDPDFSLLGKPLHIRIDGHGIDEAFQFEKPISTPGASFTRLSTRGASDDLDVALEVNIAFDGLVTYNLSFTAKRTTTLEELQLNFAVRDAEGLCYQDGSWSRSGFVDLLESNTWSATRFYPILWVGSLERGLYWTCEAVHPAIEEHARPWVKVTTNATMCIDLVNIPLNLKAGESYKTQFAFGVTPMRPKGNSWRTVRFRAQDDSNTDMVWSTPDFFAQFGFPSSSNPAALDQYLQGKKHLDTFLFYQIPTFGMTSLPQWNYFESQWKGFPTRSYPKETSMAKWGHDLIKVDITQQSWCDLYLQHLDEFLDRFAFQGVYYDCFDIDSLTQDGRYIYPVFSFRDFLMRIYNTQRLDRPNSYTLSHTGSNFCSPASGFSDTILMGEHYRAGCMEHDHLLQFLSLKRFRYENCVNIGADRMFLPQYRQAEKQQSEPIAVSTLGLLMTHNLLLYPSFINSNVIHRVLSRKHKFDVTQADFFPYWEANPLEISTHNDKVIVSYYRNNKGLLLTLLNVSGDAQKAALSVNVERIMKDYPGAKVYLYDPLDDKTTEWAFDGSTEIEPYMAKMILVSPVNDW